MPITPLIGGIAGAAGGLIYTAVKDLFEDDGPDLQKIAEVRSATSQRISELESSGMSRYEAGAQARQEFKQALEEASKEREGTTLGDYMGNAMTGATIGAGVGWASGTGRGVSVANKLKSFLTSAKEAPRVESVVGGLRTTDPARTAAQQVASREIKEPAVKASIERMSAERAASTPPSITEPIADVAKTTHRRGRVQIVGSDVARAMEGKATEAADEGAGMMFKRLGPAGRPFAGGGGPQSFLGFGDDADEVAKIDDIMSAALAKHMPVKGITLLPTG